jgi:nucleoid-associated protein YgaU
MAPPIVAEAPPVDVAAAPPVTEPVPASQAMPDVTVPSAAPTYPGPAPVIAPPAAVAAAEPEIDPSIPTLVAIPMGDPTLQRFASGRAIIRRGDNLWTIARRVYGKGIKYTAIYEANDAQIVSPSRIYPGQVFDLPAETE